MSFRVLEARYERRTVQLTLNQKQRSSENTCTIIIGKNGAGKSRLLAQICRVFAALDNDSRLPAIGRTLRSRASQKIAVTYEIDAERVLLDTQNNVLRSNVNGLDAPRPPSPRRVIAATISPSDKFPVESRQRYQRAGREVEYPSRIYRYLGAKSDLGYSSSYLGQLSRVTESLVMASGKDLSGISRLSQIFEMLGYHPRIEVHYEVRRPVQDPMFMTLLLEAKDDPRSLEYLRSRTVYHTAGSHRSKAALADFKLVEKLGLILPEVLSHAAGGKLTISLDISSADFEQGSLFLFQSIQTLSDMGFAVFRDLRFFKNTARPKAISISEASSGEQAVVLTMLGIAGHIEDNSLVVIDEPEISLHPEWQERFVPLLASTFSRYRGCHFLLATHSPQILANGAEANAAVVTMDDLSIRDSAELSKKSSDFQLATMFDTPGYGNEYLARESLSALHLASKRDFSSREFLQKLGVLREARPHLHADDPVAQLVDALLNAVANRE